MKRPPAVIKAAVAGLTVRAVDRGGDPWFEVTIAAQQDMPPGHRPPTMVYLMPADHCADFVRRLTEAMDASSATSPKSRPETH